jgi:hypothetical protein
MLLAAAGAWLWTTGQRTNGGVALRVAAVMAAIWFAWPSLRRITPKTMILGAAALAIGVYRPASLWVVLPLLIAASRLLTRTRSAER